MPMRNPEAKTQAERDHEIALWAIETSVKCHNLASLWNLREDIGFCAYAEQAANSLRILADKLNATADKEAH